MRNHFVIARNPHANNAYQKALLLAYTPPQYNEHGDCVMMAGCRIQFEDQSQWNTLPRYCSVVGTPEDHPLRGDTDYERSDIEAEDLPF